MTIPTSAQPTPITSPVAGKLLVNPQTGSIIAGAGLISLQQMHDYVVNMCRTFPCNASTASNVITLTMLSVQPTVTQYADFDSYGFIADASSTGNLTALVVTSMNTFATLNVYKSNGGTQAGSGDITSGRQYFLTYVDSLNSNAGGFVLR